MIIFRRKTEIVFLFFAQNVEAVLKSTQNLCFTGKIEKYVFPCKSQFYYIKVGGNGVYIILMFLFLRSYK